MKKIILGLLFSAITYVGFSQTTQTITTEDGVKTVQINADGTSQIDFTAADWASITPLKASGICINLGTRRSHCTGGLGFRCGVFSCNPPPQSQPTSRTQPAVVINNVDGSVTLKFTNPVDWVYLQNN